MELRYYNKKMDVQFIVSAFRNNQYPPPDRPEIAFAGRSNVGKSSLLNTLVNHKKAARTSSKPGRTQSINFFHVGKNLSMVDLPGYGFANVPLEVKKSWQKMVETYLSTRESLKAVFVILDIRREPASGDIDLITWLKHYHIKPVTILTKADKLSRQQAIRQAGIIKEHFKDLIEEVPVIFSAKTRQGRDEIWERIKNAALIDDINSF